MNTLELYKRRIDETLLQLIPSASSFYPSLYEGAKYALAAPGKRIRPLLTLCTVEMFKGDFESAVIPACALEMVHTYSLIHDDLPCMDDDDFRRGLPTLHRVYSEGHAVLVGDYLLTYAYELLSTAPQLLPEQKIALIQTLSKATGSEGMIGGQIMDIEKSKHIEQTHTHKTAALFSAAVAFGGIVARCDLKTVNQLHAFGLQFGKFFQMVDDLLDHDHPLGHEHAHAATLDLYASVKSALALFSEDTSTLTELVDLVFSQYQQPELCQ